MNIEKTLILMGQRPRMFVLDASGMYHFLSGILSEKRDNNTLQSNEISLLACFLSWKKNILQVDSPIEVFSFYDNYDIEDGLICMAQDLYYAFKELLPFYVSP